MAYYYRNKYYLNASHSFDGTPEHTHAHTFSIELYLIPIQRKKKEQYEVEGISYVTLDYLMESYLEPLRGQNLNETEKFENLSPTLENMGEVFYEELKVRLEQNGFELVQLDISENPVKVYSVSERILLSSKYRGDMRKNWDQILKRKRTLFHIEKK